MMLNIEELSLALKLTEAAAESNIWNQKHWLSVETCGTAGCFAGTYALATGCIPDMTSIGWNAMVITPEGDQTHVATYTQNRLGLTSTQASRLFSANNNLDDLRRLVSIYVKQAENNLSPL